MTYPSSDAVLLSVNNLVKLTARLPFTFARDKKRPHASCTVGTMLLDGNMLDDGAVVGVKLKVDDAVMVGKYVVVAAIEGLFEGGLEEHPQQV